MFFSSRATTTSFGARTADNSANLDPLDPSGDQADDAHIDSLGVVAEDADTQQNQRGIRMLKALCWS